VANAAPASPGGLARLPFPDDVNAIRALVPEPRRDIFDGFNVTRANLERLRLADYAVVHFSTHALMDDRIPEVSRIALSLVDREGKSMDGYLRSYQLARLRMNGSVVVLSACDTALGKQVLGEGLVGLSSSLFHAGAAQLVLSLAKVDAEPSAQFFAEVYRELWGGRHVSMERALTRARVKMAQSPRWSDPYYWAAFVVLGRPAD
jgi:CHAT domain-containing protein